jgi:thiol-disulfide isomerase/thioredoxin
MLAWKYAATVAALMIAGCTPGGQMAAPANAQPAGAAPPAITAVDTAAVKGLLAQARGKPALVNLWATWCPPCVAEMPHLAEFYQGYKDKATLVSLSADAADTIDSVVRPFQEKLRIPFPIHVLQERNPDVLGKSLSTELSGGLPVSLLYDGRGNLVKTWDGAVTLEMLKEAVDPLL